VQPPEVIARVTARLTGPVGGLSSGGCNLRAYNRRSHTTRLRTRGATTGVYIPTKDPAVVYPAPEVETSMYTRIHRGQCIMYVVRHKWGGYIL